MMHVEYTGFEQKISFAGAAFFPKIYSGGEKVPPGFNAACVLLDASDRSLLQWESAIKRGEELVKQGLLIMWDLQFDLLSASLEDESRFMTFQLGMQHFVEKVWPIFRESTLGVILYKGAYPQGAIEYLKMLAALLPEEASSFVFIDIPEEVDANAYFRLTALDQFGHLRLALRGPNAEKFPYAIPALAWGHFNSPLGFYSDCLAEPLPELRIEYAICLPEKGDSHLIMEVAFLLDKIPFRVIPEALLTQEWDGIEKLIIFPDHMDERGWRKIRGFSAAGGETISYPNDGASLLLPQTSLPSSLVALK